MKKVSLLAVLVLAACATGPDDIGNPLGTKRTGVADANPTAMLSIMKNGETELDPRLDDRSEDGMFITAGSGEFGTNVSFDFSTTASKKNPQTYMILTTTDIYEDKTKFTRSRYINEDLFNRAPGGRAVIADYSDIYTAFYYEGRNAPFDKRDSALTLEKIERRTDEFQVALGGGVLGLEFSDFGYWRAQYYTHERGVGTRLDSYDFQPIFGGKSTNWLGTTIADAGRPASTTFTGNAVALITYEAGHDNGQFIEMDSYYDTPVGGKATFTLGATPTLFIEFDRWYNMTFTEDPGAGNKNGNASVSITKGDGFMEKSFRLGDDTIKLNFAIGPATEKGTLAYEFYGTGSLATEMVGGFSYWQSTLSADGGLSIGVVGGFGAKFPMPGTNPTRDDGPRHDNTRPDSNR